MSMESASPATAPSPHVDERLEQIERLLFGLLPRSERLDVMATLETKVRALGARGDAALAEMAPSSAVIGRERATSQRRRSLLAITSGIVGIFALMLLLAVPVTYLFIAMAEEILGEMGAVIVAGTHSVLLALGGFLAVGLGFIALVRLLRKRGQVVGHGWAITGICAGPIPMFVGGLVVLLVGTALLETELFVAQATPPQPVQVVNAVMPVPGTTEPGPVDASTMGMYGSLPPEVGPLPTVPGAYAPAVLPANPPADNPTLQYAPPPPPALPATPPAMQETKGAEPQLPTGEAEKALPQPEVKEEPAGETKEPATEAAVITAETTEQPSKPAE